MAILFHCKIGNTVDILHRIKVFSSPVGQPYLYNFARGLGDYCGPSPSVRPEGFWPFFRPLYRPKCNGIIYCFRPKGLFWLKGGLSAEISSFGQLFVAKRPQKSGRKTTFRRKYLYRPLYRYRPKLGYLFR